ncbi:MAG TPA: hypothetical protein VMC85_06110, partial [Desulfomonilaceae bacterium]|nr:hypothetical protein [Desulfomonilaceae bacterium]
SSAADSVVDSSVHVGARAHGVGGRVGLAGHLVCTSADLDRCHIVFRCGVELAAYYTGECAYFAMNATFTLSGFHETDQTICAIRVLIRTVKL